VSLDTVEVAGLRVAFRRRGTGPALLLLHGAVCDSRVWRRELDAFSPDFTVVAWDAPGCGGSSDPPPTFRMAEFGDCLARFADALGLAPAHVLGHSWGSTLAFELYRQRPGLVRSLVLVGAYAGWGGSLPPDETARRLQFALDVADTDPREFEPTTMRGLFSERMPDDRANELVAIMREVRPAGTRTMAHALADADLRDMLPSIDVPTLLVHGSRDERSSLDVAGSLHAAIPRSALTVLPGLGHECYLEDGAAFEVAVRDFLRTVP
jgi:pimeloyl-ACP methyl ester carboxylesterase